MLLNGKKIFNKFGPFLVIFSSFCFGIVPIFSRLLEEPFGEEDEQVPRKSIPTERFRPLGGDGRFFKEEAMRGKRETEEFEGFLWFFLGFLWLFRYNSNCFSKRRRENMEQKLKQFLGKYAKKKHVLGKHGKNIFLRTCLVRTVYCCRSEMIHVQCEDFKQNFILLAPPKLVVFSAPQNQREVFLTFHLPKKTTKNIQSVSHMPRLSSRRPPSLPFVLVR